jgi:hypothetical protein
LNIAKENVSVFPESASVEGMPQDFSLQNGSFIDPQNLD